MTVPAPALPAQVRRGLPVMIGGRLVSNVAFRFVYPFLPAISRGLGVSIETAGIALSIRELSGLVAPALGRIIDRGRRRLGMFVGLVAAGVSLALTAASPGVVAFTIGIVAFSIAKVGYDTAMSTWIGDHVPYARRGQIIGLSELSWAVALLVGIPLVGALIDAVGWRAPFVVVGVVCVAVGLLLPARIEADPPRPPGPHARLRLLPGAVALYVVMGLLSFSMQLVIVVHGFWLEDEFGLTVAAIGISSILLGAGELAGSGATVSLTDRLGKRRSVLVGSVALVPPLALFGITDGRVAVALALLTLAVLAFEFAFVSALPLVTELDPEARGSAVGVALAVVTVTRALGTVAATTLYSAQGMGAVGGAAAAGIAIAAVVVATAVQEPEPTTVTV